MMFRHFGGLGWSREPLGETWEAFWPPDGQKLETTRKISLEDPPPRHTLTPFLGVVVLQFFSSVFFSGLL